MHICLMSNNVYKKTKTRTYDHTREQALCTIKWLNKFEHWMKCLFRFCGPPLIKLLVFLR